MADKRMLAVADEQMLNVAHKVAFLIEAYPEHTMTEIISLLQMPSVDINAGIWLATELEIIAEPDEKGMPALLNKPDEWKFGATVQHLEDQLEFCFLRLERKEADMEEHFLTDWTLGYPPQDIFIALKHLEQLNKVVPYDVVDGENTYVFYTGGANVDKRWGEKQYKESPIPNKKKR